MRLFPHKNPAFHKPGCRRKGPLCSGQGNKPAGHIRQNANNHPIARKPCLPKGKARPYNRCRRLNWKRTCKAAPFWRGRASLPLWPRGKFNRKHLPRAAHTAERGRWRKGIRSPNHWRHEGQGIRALHNKPHKGRRNLPLCGLQACSHDGRKPGCLNRKQRLWNQEPFRCSPRVRHGAFCAHFHGQG